MGPALSFGLDRVEEEGLLLASGVTGLKPDNDTVFSDVSVGVNETVRVLLPEPFDEVTLFR